MRYFVEIAFVGTPFLGWQIQAEGQTVQSVVNEVLSAIFRTPIYCLGCGRTDSGVHAKQFYIHFDVQSPIDDLPLFLNRFNGIAPDEISAKRIFLVQDDAHARFSAISRTYEYYITTVKDPFWKGRAAHIRRVPDLNLMNIACEKLLGKKDFKAFSKVNDLKNHICDLTQAKVESEGDLIKFTFTANRFLRNMVRAMVGTLLDIGYEKKSLADLDEIMKSKLRSEAGQSVSAAGLYLDHIEYPFIK
jgi:tRNA pseudouridine38-40 synthase